MARKPIILVCDDDEDDIELVTEAFKEACIEADFQFASDGRELVDYLKSTNECQSVKCPEIILLDLNMPRMDGRQALEWIKSLPGYRYIPVVVYTTSNARDDVNQCYGIGANSFMTKCASFKDLVEKVKTFAGYWSDVATLPKCVR